MPTFLPRFWIEQPGTLAEASEMLTDLGDEGRAYAGGTELLLAMKHAGLQYRALVDVKTIPGLDTIEQTNGHVRVGSLVTHRALEVSPLIQQRLPALADLESKVANPRVRASGTLGGNLCFAEPHSDPAALLLVLDARLKLVSPGGSREVTLDQFIVGAYDVDLKPGELLESVTIPVPGANQRATYKKFQIHERPMLGLALALDFDGDAITAGRVAVGSASPIPRRSAAAEAMLAGPVGEVENHLDDAADTLADEADLIDDLEGSAEYKRHLIHVFLRQQFRDLVQSRGAR